MKNFYGKCFSILIMLPILISCFATTNSEINVTKSILPTTSPSLKVNITTSPAPSSTPTPDPYRIDRGNIDDLILMAKFGNENYIGMDWSPDGKYIAAYGEIYLEIFDANDFRVMHSIKLSEAFAKVNCKRCSSPTFGKLLFSPDGSQIAITTFDNSNYQILLWDVQSGEIENMINGGSNYFSSIAYSSDSSLIAGCNGFSSDKVFVWNTKTGENTNNLTDTELGCFNIAINEDNSKLVSYGLTNTLRIWDLKTNALITEIELAKGKALAISPQGDKFAIETNSNKLQIYDFDGILLQEILPIDEEGFFDEIYTIQYNPSGDLLVSGSRWGTVQFFEVSSGNLVREVEVDGYEIYETRFSPDGKKLAILTHDGHIRIWALSEYANTHATVTPVPNTQIQKNYEFLQYDQYILYSSEPSGMKIRSIDGTIKQSLTDNMFGYPISADGRIIQLLQEPFGSVTGNTLNLLDGVKTINNISGYVSPNGDWIARMDYSDAVEKGITFFNTIDHSEFFIPLNLPDQLGKSIVDDVNELSWTPDGKQIVYLRYTWRKGTNGVQTPWDVFPTNGLYIMNAACLQKSETCLDTQRFIYSPYKIYNYQLWSLSPDGRYAIVNGGNYFILFDIVNSTIERIPVNINNITSYYSSEVFISPDNQWVVFSTSDENVYIQPLFGGKATKIMDASDYKVLLGWLTGPHLQIGDSFKVLPDGDHVYIRGNPDLDSNEITYLISGNTFTVLDGPIQEDGYTWWYVHSDVDGTEGWISEFYGWYELIE